MKICPLRFLTMALLTAFPTTSALAVFPFTWSTNSSGTVSGGSWVGNGTVQPNLNPASTTAQIAVQNLTAGTMTIDNMGGNLFSSGRLLTNPVSATHSITLTGGTADLRLHNSNNYDAGGSLFNSVGLTDFQGVTEVAWTIRFSEPLAGRDSDVGSLTTRPMGAGLALINAGTNQTISSFTVSMQYSQIYRYDAVNDIFVPGVPASALPYQNSGFGAPVAGATAFTSNQFNGLDEFLLVRGYDVNGGGYGASDADDIYMREMTWTIRRDDNQAFASNTLFTMSMDGKQYPSVQDVPPPPAAIPEPSSVLLVMTTLLGGILRRRRV